MIACTNNHKTKGIDRKEEATNLLTAALLASQTQSIAPMILLFPLPFPDRKLRRTISFFMISYCYLATAPSSAIAAGSSPSPWPSHCLKNEALTVMARRSRSSAQSCVHRNTPLPSSWRRFNLRGGERVTRQLLMVGDQSEGLLLVGRNSKVSNP
jgi:hypothetical protein